MELAEVLELIADGVDPTTGEVFDTSVLYTDDSIVRAVTKLAVLSLAANVKKPELPTNANADLVFNELREWRKGEAFQRGLPAYCIFSDKELHSIANSAIEKKSDLLLCNGINRTRYFDFSDDLFALVSQCI